MDRLVPPGRERSPESLSLFPCEQETATVTDEWYGRATSPSATTVNIFVCFRSRFQTAFRRGGVCEFYLDMERIYLVTLAKDTESPTAPRSDEVGKAEEKEKEKEKESEEKKSEEKKSPSPSPASPKT